MINSATVLNTPRPASLTSTVDQRPSETRHAQSADVPTAPADTSRAAGDRELLSLYTKALRRKTGDPQHDREIMVDNIPPHSTFGQWWAQLGRAIRSQDVNEWLTSASMNKSSLLISPERGEITDGIQRFRASGPLLRANDQAWSQLSGPIIEAGKVVNGRGGPSFFKPPLSGDSTSAPLDVITNFYYQPEYKNPQQSRDHADELERHNTFWPIPTAQKALRNEEELLRQKNSVGDKNTRLTAAREFKQMATRLETGSLYEQEIHSYLQKPTLQVDPHSSFPTEHLSHWGEASLMQYLQENDLDIPKTRAEVDNLAAALFTPPPKSATFGNYGGAFKWPVPLDITSQRQLQANIRFGKFGDIELAPYKNVLDYLIGGEKLEPSDVQNPRQTLDQLIKSQRGQALGEAIKASFDAKSVKGSVNDWLLAALNVDMKSPLRDSKSHIESYPWWRTPYSYGKSASAIVEAVVRDMDETGRASSPETARLLTHLLLASRAPELLVKDIPNKVTFGSHSWVALATAVRRLEAQAPGSTATMSYSQVMLQASIAPISARERAIEYTAQQEALKDWGAVNGMPSHTEAQMAEVSKAYDARIAKLKTASEALRTPMPVAKEMALAHLRKAFPDMDPALFEKHCITLEPSVADFPGPYSVLDLYMDGRSASGAPTPHYDAFYTALFRTTSDRPSASRFISESPDVDIDAVLAKIKHLPNISDEFKKSFREYVDSVETGISVQLRNLIARQPIEIRRNLEYGKVTIVREDQLTYTPYSLRVSTLPRENNNLLIKTEHDGQIHTYEVDLKQDRIVERTDLGDFRPGKFPLNHTHPGRKLVEVRGAGEYSSGVTDARNGSSATPDSFNSERTSYLADAYVKNMNISELRKEAMGQTTFNTETPFYKKAYEFMLNLIPLRSAIVNFSNGNIGEGILDLSLDVFGFVIGAGAAAKSAKVLSVGASAFSKVVHGAKILGRAAIGALNPVDGIPDLVKGAVKVGRSGFKAASQGFKKLTHSAGSYDLLHASKRFDASSMGTFKVNNEILEGPVVLQNGKWHHYSPITGQAYGPALKDFVPSAQLNSQELGKWVTANGTASTVSGDVVTHWKKTVNAHRNGPEKEAFERGYLSGNPQTIKGVSKHMKAEDVMKLANNQDLTAEQIGMLVKKYDDIAYEFGRSGSARFIDAIEPRFGEVIPMPQVIYLSQTAQLSDGQCAALSRAMATAMAHGKEQVLIKNMFTAAAFPADPASRAFIARLSKIQTQVGSQAAFHAGQPTRQVSLKGMVKELADSDVSKSVMIDSPAHAMAAGVRVDGTRKTFYFYDPNHGLAQFPSAEAMEKGLEKLTRDKKLTPQYRTHSTDPNKLEFKVFDHDDAWQQKNSVFSTDVNALYDAPITPSGAAPMSNAELIKNWDTLGNVPENQGLICYEASLRVGQAEKTFTPAVFDAVQATTNRRGGTNYSQRYLEIMGIKPDSLNATFNTADITESGLINFKHANEGGLFGHTVYIQKTKHNELYLFNTNSPDLDIAMAREGNKPTISGGMTVYHLDGNGQKGLQRFLDGIDGKTGWQFAYTPASTLKANVQKLTP
ncbi:hypothetical protein [Pseudomonas sp. MPB23]|uniref:hypothetical protein n=1 Tax=Pseudomonas sp. MPB23 TaxID=3388490 RepID=UPI0039853BB5